MKRTQHCRLMKGIGMVQWGSILLYLLGSVLPVLAITLDENHALDPNAHHGKLHGLTHSKGGEDQVNIENLRTTCAAGQIPKSDGSNGLVCSADSGEATASYVTINAEAGLSSESVLGTQVIMEDLFSSRPAAGTRGRLFFASDNKVLYRDNVSGWTQITNTTNFTAGSVLYTGGFGGISGDSGHFFWDETAQRLSLSTEPSSAEDVFLRYTTYGVNTSLNKGLVIRGARGSLASPTTVASGDSLGLILAQGYDSASFQPAAAIDFTVATTPGVGDMPGSIIFSTTPDGSPTLTERMRITHDGIVNLASSVLVLGNTKNIRGFNAASSATIGMINVNSSDRVSIAVEGNDIQLGRAPIAIGSGSALATTALVIGCSGCPATATQNGWAKFFDNAGNAMYVPIWR